MEMEAQLKALSQAIIDGKRLDAAELTKQLIEGGTTPKQILNDALIAGMEVIGERYKNCEIYLPEMLTASRAMKAAMEILRPHLVRTGVQPIGRAVIGTVQGDLHDIGKNLVVMMAEGAGFEVFDLGVDVGPEKFVHAVQQHSPQIVGMSALLTTTLPHGRGIIQALEGAGVRDKVKVIVGGAAVTDEWAKEIGADGYAPDAASAVDKCKELLAQLSSAA